MIIGKAQTAWLNAMADENSAKAISKIGGQYPHPHTINNTARPNHQHPRYKGAQRVNLPPFAIAKLVMRHNISSKNCDEERLPKTRAKGQHPPRPQPAAIVDDEIHKVVIVWHRTGSLGVSAHHLSPYRGQPINGQYAHKFADQRCANLRPKCTDSQ